MGTMAISFAEATRCLLGGKPLAWAAFDEHKAESLTLVKPGQRRLFAFLLAQDRAKVGRGDEELFAGLVAAWNKDGVDPAADGTNEIPESSKDVWRLDRIEASGFGGLTLFGRPPFELPSMGRIGACSGKTARARPRSLAPYSGLSPASAPPRNRGGNHGSDHHRTS